MTRHPRDPDAISAKTRQCSPNLLTQHRGTATSDEHDHEHAFELVEVLRVVFVALAAAAVWFHLVGAIPPGQRDRTGGDADRRLPHLQRGV